MEVQSASPNVPSPYSYTRNSDEPSWYPSVACSGLSTGLGNFRAHLLRRSSNAKDECSTTQSPYLTKSTSWHQASVGSPDLDQSSYQHKHIDDLQANLVSMIQGTSLMKQQAHQERSSYDNRDLSVVAATSYARALKDLLVHQKSQLGNIVIHNEAQAFSKVLPQESEQQKESLLNRVIAPLGRFWASSLNRFFVLSIGGVALYCWYEYRRDCLRLEALQQRLDSNPINRFRKIISSLRSSSYASPQGSLVSILFK